MNESVKSNEHCHSLWLPRPARIESIQPEVDGVATYTLLAKQHWPESRSFLPGQFNMLYLPGCGEVAISISGGNRDGELLEHTIRYVGRVTNAIAKLQPGSELGLRGPFGTPWPVSSGFGRDVVIVAGGLGLAPLKPVIEAIGQERQKFNRVTLFIGARSPDLLLFSRDYAKWEGCGIDIQLTVDRDPQELGYTTGVVPLLIDRWAPSDPQNTLALVCGPEVMMDYSARSLLKKRLDAKSIFLSLERNMQCAVGICGHCQLGPAFICKDGPVLNYERLQSYFAVRDL